jgi:ABC-type Fe3+/spermidine/putrescine transport system ATPase subunit
MELKRLQHAVGITFIVVTHDHEEALALADRVTVMRSGRVLQVGPADELWERPTSRAVATALGEANVLRGVVMLRPDGAMLRVGEVSLPIDGAATSALGLVHGSLAAIVIRPERTRLSAIDHNSKAVVRGHVTEAIYLGGSRKVVVDLPEGGVIMARVDAGSMGDLTVGDEVAITWQESDGILVVDD